jgi:hypothetical protein
VTSPPARRERRAADAARPAWPRHRAPARARPARWPLHSPWWDRGSDIPPGADTFSRASERPLARVACGRFFRRPLAQSLPEGGRGGARLLVGSGGGETVLPPIRRAGQPAAPGSPPAGREPRPPTLGLPPSDQVLARAHTRPTRGTDAGHRTRPREAAPQSAPALDRAAVESFHLPTYAVSRGTAAPGVVRGRAPNSLQQWAGSPAEPELAARLAALAVPTGRADTQAIAALTAAWGERVFELAPHLATPLGEMATELRTARLSRP